MTSCGLSNVVSVTPRPKLYLNQYRVHWSVPALVQGYLVLESLKVFPLKGLPRKRQIKSAHGVAPGGPPALQDAPQDGDDDQAYFNDLMEDLGLIQEEGSDDDGSDLSASEADSDESQESPPGPGPGPAPPGPHPEHPQPPPPPQPEPPRPPRVAFTDIIDSESRGALVVELQDRCSRRLAGIKAAGRELKKQPKGVEPGFVSMVKTEDIIQFIQWTSHVESLMGNIVRIDEDNKAISQFGYGRPKSYTDSTILIPQIPLIYGKVNKASGLRPPIPDWCMALFFIESARQSSGPYLLDKFTVNRFACVRCQAAKDLGIRTLRDSSRDDLVYLCHSCGSSWHQFCASDSFAVPSVGLFDTFKCFVCEGEDD